MSLTIDQFDDFFAAVNGGHRPFAWQRRLVADLAERRGWPERIDAPTASGKTAVIEAHVFAVAVGADVAPTGQRLPRRLALVVDRRAIVDAQYERARQLATALNGDGGSPIVRAVADALRSLGPARTAPLSVYLMRGGVPPSPAWRDDPTGCAVICATPDLFGSRVLFRGYGTSRNARPHESGLLAYDTVAVVDEAHLARQLVRTARRIHDLERMATDPLPARPLQVVELGATPTDDVQTGSSYRTVGVEADDLTSAVPADRTLALRLQTAKPIQLIEAPWPADKSERKGLAERMANLAVEARASQRRFAAKEGPSTIACIVNTVVLAIDVQEALRRLSPDDDPFVTRLLVGRMRPHDLRLLHDRHPGLFMPEGDPAVDFIVATQTIEVGVDMDFPVMITELAPGAALAQRAGRVNRLGRSPNPEVIVVVPPAGTTVEADAGPYRAAELAAGLDWLQRRAADPLGLAPWAIRNDPPPPGALRRGLLQRLEAWDAWLLARTSDELFAEPDVDFWLSDDLEADLDVSVVVRQVVPADRTSAVALLQATPPRAREAFPVKIGVVRSLIENAAADAPVLVVRGPSHAGRQEVTDVRQEGDLRPGDVVVIDGETAWFREGVVVAEGMTETATDVLEETEGDVLDGSLVVRIAPGAPVFHAIDSGEVATLLARLAATVREHPRDSRSRRAAMADVIQAFIDGHDMVASRLVDVVNLLRGPLYRTDVVVGAASDGDTIDWIVVTQTGRSSLDETLVQESTPSGQPVTLVAHQAAVAKRAASIARSLGLDPRRVAILEDAGAWHDAGKRDPRFQRKLRHGDEIAEESNGEILAKSGRRPTSAVRAAPDRFGLPSGWRHEQLSAADAWIAIDSGDAAARELVVRLVGTSHGHGRSGFAHASARLCDRADGAWSSAQTLYDDGAWDAIIERTHAEIGIWGCAYLEALLRAADHQVSGEGS